MAGGYLGDGGQATDAALYEVRRTAIAPDGAIYVADKSNHRVRRIGKDGRITTYAGSGESGFSGDGGPAIRAKLHFPEAVAVDSKGNVYIADVLNNRVRRVSTDGIITTYAGNGRVTGFDYDVLSTSTSAGYPKSLFFDKNDNLYVCDTDFHRVYRIAAADRMVTLIIGEARQAGQTGVNRPSDVTVDDDGNIYISERDGHRIRRITKEGAISNFAGTGRAGFGGDGGAPINAEFNEPSGLWLDGIDLYVADTRNHRIRRIRNNIITTVVGSTRGFDGDGGPAARAQLWEPRGVSMDAERNLYISDTTNNRVRRVARSTGIISTIAGAGDSSPNGDGGPAIGALFQQPQGLRVEPDGTILVVDPRRNSIRAIDRNGIVSTFSGGGEAGFAGDGSSAASARYSNPWRIAGDGKGTYYVTDTLNHKVRKIDSAGRISTFAGTTAGFSGDGGAATQARLAAPTGVAVHPISGDVYISERAGSCVRRVDGSGRISTFAGRCGNSGFSGDNGFATGAQLSEPLDIAFDSRGNLYIADNGNNRVRMVRDGTITTVAGDGRPAYYTRLAGESLGLGGAARNAALGPARAIALDADDNLYMMSDGFIFRIDRETQIVQPIAGNGEIGFSGDEVPSRQATLSSEGGGIAVDRNGNVYIAEVINARVRVISSAAATTQVTFNTNPPGQRVIVDGREVPHGQQIRWLPGSTHRISVNEVQGSGPTRYVFSGWSSGQGSTQDVRAGSASVYTANFTAQHRLALSIQGSGTVDLSPPSPDGVYYDAGTSVALTPTPGPDWSFGEFSGDASGTGPITVSMDSPKRVTASFSAPKPELSVTPSNLAFKLQEGGEEPVEQIVTIASTGAPLTFSTAGSAAYVRVSASQTTTPGVARVGINPAGLRPGTYTQTVTVRSPEAGSVLAIPVSVEVTAAPVKPDLIVTPRSLDITVTGGTQSLSRMIEATSSSAALRLGWNVRSGAQWLVVRAEQGIATTPTRLQVDISPAGLAPGAYSGRIEVNSTDAANPPQIVLVNLTIEPESVRQLLTSAQQMSFQYQQKRQAAAPTPASQQLDVSSNQPSTRFFARPAFSTSSQWLFVRTADGSPSTVAPSSLLVDVVPEGLAAGSYEGSVELRLTQNGDTVTRVPVRLDVLAPLPPELITDRSAQGFDLPAGPAQDSIVWSIQNNAEDPVDIGVTSGADWLKASAERSNASQESPALVRVTADAAGLSPGTYRSDVVAQGADARLSLPVVLTVSDSSRKLVVSQARIDLAVRSGSTGFRTLDLIANGAGTGNWSATVTTERGGNWLKLEPAAGVLGSNQPVRTNLTASSAGLTPGSYGARIRIVEGTNVEEVVVNLDVTTGNTPPVIDTTGVALVAAGGGATSRVTVGTFYDRKKGEDIRIAATTPWLRFSPAVLRLSSANGGGAFEIWAEPGSLNPGVHRGTVVVDYQEGSSLTVGVVLVIPAAGQSNLAVGSTSLAFGRKAADGCQPTKYSAVFANRNGLRVRIGQSAQSEFVIVDNCGGLVKEGAAANTFSSGDRPVDLRPSGDGAWRASWIPRVGEDNQISIQLNVLGTAGALEVDSPNLSTYLLGRSPAPVLDRKTPFLVPGQRTRALAIAPGGRFIIQGENLADARVQSATGALLLASTRVTLGGLPVMLISVSPTEIEAVAPRELRTNATHSLVVTRGFELSAPERLAVAESWPTIIEAGTGRGGAIDLLLTNLGPKDLDRTVLTVNGNSCALSKIEPVRNEPGIYFGQATGCASAEGAPAELSTASGSRTATSTALRGQAGKSR